MVIKTGSLNSLHSDDSDSLNNDILTAILHSAEDLVTGTGWLESINNLLAEIGKATGVSRVWIFQTLELNEDSILQDYVFEWASSEKYVQIGLPQLNYFTSSLAEPEYKAIVESRIRGEYQHLVMSQLSDCWLKTFLQQQNILSMLTVPIIVNNKWWGVLGLDDCERENRWSAREITLLRTASFFISSAIMRESLSAKNKQLEILQESTACSSWELDTRRGHLWCTSEILSQVAQTTRTLHFTFRELIRRVHPDSRHEILDKARSLAAGKQTDFQNDLKIKSNNGTYIWVEILAKNIPTDSVVAGICWDITKRKEEEERLLKEATTDPLTGVINRRKLITLAKNSLNKLKSSNESFSVAMLDLDFFKRINDKYGHMVGDKVLIHFTSLCQSALRQADAFGRIGGEEFALLLPNTKIEEAQAICERICSLVSNTPYHHQGASISYSVSIGCITVTDGNAYLRDLIDSADKALYQAKNSGRNQVIVRCSAT
ncbi:hypothetical protein NM22_00725 [Vibrio tubiashii]|nr:hypothetical protein NM22_00725 [Vibrio tubiashii]